MSTTSSNRDRRGESAASTIKSSKPESVLRPFGGLFGSSSSSGSGRDGRQRRRDTDASGNNTDTGGAVAPSVFVPLAARLLDPIKESSCVYLPDQPSCVAVSNDGRCAAAGTEQGTVAIFRIDAEMDVGDVSSAAASALLDADPALLGSGLPLLFATGLADPMNTSIGYTSMAAFGRDAAMLPGAAKAGQLALRHVVHGHDAAVLDVAVNADHDVVASASSDGTVIMWSARTGQYLRTLAPAFISGASLGSSDIVPPAPSHHERYARVERVLISAEALVICYSVSGSVSASENCDRLDPVRALNQSARAMPACKPAVQEADHGVPASQDAYGSSQRSSNTQSATGSHYVDEGAAEVAALHVYSVNGRHLRTRKLVHHLRDMALTQDGRYGACVSLDARVAVFDAHTLGVVRQFELPCRGCSVAWSGASEQQLVVGCEGGRLVVISVDLASGW
ncbi:hypothetical protein H4S02_007745 [Coemansia sp. RSA 2611]|nr:hypothetical protein H4S01_005275 [Coemansia sp. RSA 2610]KAJ2377096.1 hypothetical protein H4S02_007745 [Coemansia sp. RSA 2611]